MGITRVSPYNEKIKELKQQIEKLKDELSRIQLKREDYLNGN